MNQPNIEIKSYNYDNNGVFIPKQKKPHNYKYLVTFDLLDYRFYNPYPVLKYHHWNREDEDLVHKPHEAKFRNLRFSNGRCEFYLYIKVNELTDDELNEVFTKIAHILEPYGFFSNMNLLNRLYEANERLGDMYAEIIENL